MFSSTVTAAVFTLATLCAAGPVAPRTGTIVDIAVGDKDLSTLVAALKDADLVDVLNGAGPFTVFAPTNEAFALLPRQILADLLKPENKAALIKVLTYHVVSGDIQTKDIKSGERVKTIEGDDVTPFLSERKVYIEGGSRENVAEVLKADVEASNGVIHIVNRVLISPHFTPPSPPTPNATKNIVELAESSRFLSTLVKALSAADLVKTLEGPGPFTVFAPTDEAFDRLPARVLEDLLKPENKPELIKVLTYHVVAGNIQAKDIKNDAKVKTVEGDSVTTFISHTGHVYIEGGSRENFAKVIEANLEATNGVVHLIDYVLIPPQRLL